MLILPFGYVMHDYIKCIGVGKSTIRLLRKSVIVTFTNARYVLYIHYTMTLSVKQKITHHAQIQIYMKPKMKTRNFPIYKYVLQGQITFKY